KVFGVIIGKTDVRSFPDRKIEIERFTFGFTIRDSAEFFINVSAWGGEAFISGLADSFSIGDCIIENPLVSTKDPEKGDKFCPATPHYRLLLTETHSQVSVCGDGVERLLPLLHLPVKDSRDFYSLADIVANGQQLDGAVINVLAALFVADTKMSFDSFRGSMVATVSSKTIITVNPTREASLLFSYVKDLSESGALFDLLVDVTDHTGTLQACSLRGPVAEQTLGCTQTEEFVGLTDGQRTALKWRFLLERCKIYLKILPCARMKSGMRGTILACSLADPGEVK
uniref:Meiosis specific with OB-fold n=1 Tax=Poecilia latipinna TaxID=48699 RepID=A0A3B3UAV0_9TELE